MKFVRFIVYILVLQLVILLSSIGVGIAGPEADNRGNILRQQEANEFVKCREVLEIFFKAWINRNYADMCQYIYNYDEKKKEEFIRQHKDYEKKGVKLVNYKIFPPLLYKHNKGKTYKVNLKFNKDLLPEITSGVYSFEMTEKGANWKIEAIQKPANPPDFTKTPFSSSPSIFPEGL